MYYCNCIRRFHVSPAIGRPQTWNAHCIVHLRDFFLFFALTYSRLVIMGTLRRDIRSIHSSSLRTTRPHHRCTQHPAALGSSSSALTMIRSTLLCLALLAAACNAAFVVRQQISPAVIIPLLTTSPIPSQSAQPTQPAVPLPQASSQPTVVPNPTISPTAGAPAPSASATAGVVSGGDPAEEIVPTPSPEPVSTRLSRGAIAGIVVGVIVLLLLIIGLLFLVLRDRGDEDGANNVVPGGSAPSNGGAAGGYATPDTGAARSLPAAAGVAGGAGGAAVAASEGTIQETELAEAEASMPGEPAGYVVSDSARHHGAVAAAPVVATAAGAGAAGIVAAAPPPNPDDRAPSPAPHDYVVGFGPIDKKSDFEDIKTRFARDEITDKSAVLGATSPPAIEGNTNPVEEKTGALEAPLETVEEVTSAEPVTAAPEAGASGKHDLLENVTSEERSGDVSVAVGGLGATEIIAEEAAATPTLEKDAMPGPTSG